MCQFGSYIRVRLGHCHHRNAYKKLTHNVELALVTADNVCIFSEIELGKCHRVTLKNPPLLNAECYRERVLNQISLNGVQNEEISLGCGVVQPLGSTAKLNLPPQSAELLSSPGSQT